MKKILAMVLTLALLAALFVTPALAAVNVTYVECPNCGDDEALLYSGGTESVYNTVSVTSCDYSSSSHSHTQYRMRHNAECQYCGTVKVWYGSITRTFCGASNMWLGVTIVDEIM